jgi:NAD(P)H dehydrogenase (quinone)
MPRPTLLVTGASGQLGRRVLELLLARDAGPLVAVTRAPAKLADLAARGVDVRRGDFDDEAGLAAAARGASRALLISTDALDRPGHRLAQHQAAIRAFAAAGVAHVVYTSCPNPYVGSPVGVADDHRRTEEALAATGLDFTILRNNLYIDLQLHALPRAVASGQLVDARGDGAIAWVTRDDCARAAAAALAATTGGRRTLDVTGPAAITSAELARIAADVTGRPVVHVPVALDALVAGMVASGMPEPIARLYASFDAGAARGDFATATATVEQLTGARPQSVREFLAAHRAALVA